MSNLRVLAPNPSPRSPGQYAGKSRHVTRLEQQLGELAGVRRAVVGVAVVEEQVRLFRLLGDLAHPGDPLLELVLVVQIAEALGRGEALLLPRLGVAPVEAHDGEIR